MRIAIRLHQVIHTRLYQLTKFPKLILDLALLKVDDSFTFSKTIQSIPLNDIEYDLVGREVKVSGWGVTENELSPSHLRETTIKVSGIMDPMRMAQLGRHGYGLGFRFDQDTAFCSGDSGGKITQNIMS